MQTETDKTNQPISPGKKFFFSIIILFFLYIFVELLSYGTFRLLYGGFSFKACQANREQILAPAETGKGPGTAYGPNRKNRNVLHPYFGFITEGLDPERKCDEGQDCDRRLRTYLDKAFPKSTDNNVIVGVLGGSFAHGVSTTSNVLRDAIKRLPQFKGKEVTVYHMAVGGYKQPQQLIKLSYFLSLGAEFDIVINIDGFNEIAIPGNENLSKGVNPFFPRSWYYYVDGALNDELLTLYGNRSLAKQRQKQYAAFFSSAPLNYSISANLIWIQLDKRARHKVRSTDVALINYREGDTTKRQYVTTGPDYNFISKDHFYQDLTEHWARSSILINNLCRQLGISYYHFLQPNQYVKGSKPMSEKEKGIAFSSSSTYGKSATEGYPYLMARGKKLKEEGIAYHDLTMLFIDVSKELYIDDCCHVNMPGYGMVAKDIARVVKETYPQK
ncbi:MAG: hypothetical protein ABFR63_07250 [Thermodesulfobacteriota bacterium]